MAWLGWHRLGTAAALVIGTTCGSVAIAIPASAGAPSVQGQGGFWWGGAVTDPNPHSLFGQAFLELQFYPDCPSYGGPFCTYPWYALNSNGKAFTFGADYPGTLHDYGQGFQFATTPQCGGPFGPDSTFCDTTLSPVP